MSKHDPKKPEPTLDDMDISQLEEAKRLRKYNKKVNNIACFKLISLKNRLLRPGEHSSPNEELLSHLDSHIKDKQTRIKAISAEIERIDRIISRKKLLDAKPEKKKAPALKTARVPTGGSGTGHDSSTTPRIFRLSASRSAFHQLPNYGSLDDAASSHSTRVDEPCKTPIPASPRRRGY